MKIIKKNTLYIYTDGSSYSGPRKGGIGIIYVFMDAAGEEKVIQCEEYGYKQATNNMVELHAVITGLKGVLEQEFEIKYNLIEVRTDSMYVKENYKRALFNWSKEKWLSRYGKPIENAEQWKLLVKLLPKLKCKVEIVWIK